MKVFISQPMKDKTDDEIISEREKIIEFIKDKYPEEKIEIIDSFVKGVKVKANPLWTLGKSLQLLSTADLAVFTESALWSRGCKIEYDCCIQYNIRTLVLMK